MRRRIALPLGFAAALAGGLAGTAPDARSQAKASGKDYETLKQDTADGVQLSVRYYKAADSRNNSAVILMHNYQQDPNKGGWDELAGTLAKEGFHVLRPDFRGHGGSKDVVPNRFWANGFNKQYIPGGNKAAPPKLIDAVKFKAGYFPALVNDLAATRTVLDKLNDQGGGASASTVYLIGAQEMTALGMLFLATEWNRDGRAAENAFAANARPPVVGQGSGFVSARTAKEAPAGKDYAGCVWLSPTRPASVARQAIENLVTHRAKDTLTGKGELRTDNHMLFLYGAKDQQGKKDANFYFEEVLVSSGSRGLKVDKLEFNYAKTVENTDAKGVALLGKREQLKTEDTILDFLKAMEKQRGKLPSYPRRYNDPLQIDLGAFGIGG